MTDLTRIADPHDAWIADGSGRARDEYYFAINAKRWLTPDMTVLEVGPGDGTWTIRIAPLVRALIVVSAAEDGLRRTRERCEALGIHNVDYVLASGSDVAAVPDQCIDLFFSCDAFGHRDVDHAAPDATEIVRVLKPGAICVSRYDLGDQPDSVVPGDVSNRYRDRADTLGRRCDVNPEMVKRIYEHVGLRVFAVHQEGGCCTVLATRTADSMAAPLEQALSAALAAAPGSEGRMRAVASIDALVDDLRTRLRAPLQRLTDAPAGETITMTVQDIRRIWRGE